MMCMGRIHQLPLTLISGLWLLSPTTALAVGTSAGLDISSTATVSYSIGGSNNNATSNTATFRVNEVLDVTVSWQDATNRFVTSPATNQVLSFLLSNTGNGNDSYTLSVANNLAGDQFDPSFVDIYLDTDANNLFDPAVDTLYVPGTNDPLLAADSALSIFVRNNIPAGLNGGDLGYSRLSATSKTGSGATGTVLDGVGDNTTAAVIGSSGGSSSASGSYEINGPNVVLNKSVTITDQQGGNQPMTGARLNYRIEISASGTASATGVVITDPIPANTTYAAGSLSLNGNALTDAIDGDAGDVGGTSANTVTVNLGDLAPGSPVQIITFDVTIN